MTTVPKEVKTNFIPAGLNPTTATEPFCVENVTFWHRKLVQMCVENVTFWRRKLVQMCVENVTFWRRKLVQN